MPKRRKIPFLQRIKQIQLYDATGLDSETKKGMDYAIYAVMIGMLSSVITTGAAWTGFLREVIRADDFQLGIIAAVPVAVNTLQIAISYIMERKKNRRFLFLFFGVLGRSLWILIGLIPYFIPATASMLRVWMVIVLVAFISSGNCFVNLGFQSLMSDLVPLRIRGRYFSSRQRMSLIIGILSGLLVSWIMDKTGMVGYTIVLVLAGISGILDIGFFFFFRWPPMVSSPEEHGSANSSLFTMIKGVFQNRSYVLLILFYTCWHFSVNLAAPFFNVYMLESLRMSYTQITLFNQIVSNLITVLFVARWGRLIDHYGNKPIMQIAAIGCIFIPMVWFFTTPNRTWFIIIQSIINGFFWPCMDLGQQNLSLNLSGEKNRSMYLAVFFACINLIGVALGNSIGGYLVQVPYTALEGLNIHILGVGLSKYHYIFLTSSLMRLITIFVILPLVKEEDTIPYKQVAGELIQGTKTNYKNKFAMLRYQYLRKKARKDENTHE